MKEQLEKMIRLFHLELMNPINEEQKKVAAKWRLHC